jgi:DNA (cytosine-5)-methyltransferase 1
MRYGSVCSGIEAASVAWHSVGWEPVFFSEIEPFPCAVLKHHYPAVPNYGDMTKFKEWPDESIDVLVGGTPCQSFSVAGLRAGLADPRGNLMLTYLAIADRYRPEWLVWENVPGVLSSNGGRDFGTFLQGVGELGYGFAYRILDAQYFGVAQRRRRVFVVANARGWQRAAAVLFERESLCGNLAPSREKGKEVAATIAARFGVSRNNHEELAWDENGVQRTVGTLCADTHPGAYSGQDAYTGRLVPHTFSTPAIGDIREDEVSSTLTKNTGAGGETQNPAFVAQPITFGAQMSAPQTDVDMVQTLQAKNPMAVAFAKTHKPMSDTDPEGWSPVDAAPTVTYWPRDRSDTGTDVAVVQPVVYQDSQYGVGEYPTAGSLRAGRIPEHQMVAQPICTDMRGHGDGLTAPTLRAKETANDFAPMVAQPSMQVRRLTPVECERLQGFPDQYTNIPWRKKPESPDGPRYKALGNSMAVPVMNWIGQRIQKVSEL